MKLMTDEIKKELLEAHENEQNDYENYIVDDQKVIVKYFHPMSRYTFFVISGEEINGDMIMFGYCLSPISPDFDEYGYVSLSELEGIPMMERDLYFPDTKLGDCIG